MIMKTKLYFEGEVKPIIKDFDLIDIGRKIIRKNKKYLVTKTITTFEYEIKQELYLDEIKI